MSKRRYKDPLVAKARLDRGVISVVSLAEADDDPYYWSRQSLQARLRHAELLRRIYYGKAAAGRLQRVFEVVQQKKS
jgi:hypothetical protein